MSHLRRIEPRPRRHQRGAFAIFVALSMIVLLGALGLAIDGGRVLLNKSELQSAADACALAAVAELVCTATDPSCLPRAAKKGVALANRNKRDLQSTSVSITESDVNFSTGINGPYDKSQNASRFAQCSVAPSGFTPILLGVIGVKSLTAKAHAVAALNGSQSVCTNAPIALCPGGTYTKGAWFQADYSNSSYTLSGTFRWALPSGKGASTIAGALSTNTPTCVSKGDALVFPGVASGVSDEYNSRFGLYKSASTDLSLSTTPMPDQTGYAYPTSAIPLSATPATQISAYSDYLSRHAANTPFSSTDYVDQGKKKTFSNAYKKIATSTELLQYGGDRRIVTAIMPASCSGGMSTILDSACVLMLNPMDSGAGKSTTPLYLEYLGRTSEPGSPCQSSSLPSGPADGGIGNNVPTLVQ